MKVLQAALLTLAIREAIATKLRGNTETDQVTSYDDGIANAKHKGTGRYPRRTQGASGGSSANANDASGNSGKAGTGGGDTQGGENAGANPGGNGAGGNATATKASAKGRLLAMGNFGKVQMSSDEAAQTGAKSILESLHKTNPGLSGKEDFKPLSVHQANGSNAKHLRFGQEIHGMAVEGAAIVVHTDDDGTVVAINGELVSDAEVPSEPTIDAETAVKAALEQSRVPEEEHDKCTPTELTVVRAISDGLAYLSWSCAVRYDVVGEDGYAVPFHDKIFAHATGDPGLIQIHPLIYGAASMSTQNCNQTPNNCATVSTSSARISLGDKPIESAHNYALATYDYYLNKLGRNSIDGRGMTIISRVHYREDGKPYNNAFWNDSSMAYGDGDGSTFGPFSLDADIVAHELTHGVTSYTSNLIYNGESGALNEAMSDIFGMLVDRSVGASLDAIWKIGEDTYTPNTSGDALRYMNDPARSGQDYDFYPTRYIGDKDHGGVHSNSGIANLAAYLMVMGGRHPRGRTSINVTPVGGTSNTQLGYDKLGQIFYNANAGCLTPASSFQQARFCTADIFGKEYASSVHQAWGAVGVMGRKVQVLADKGQCMDAPNDGSNRVLLWDCQNGNPNQDFSYDPVTHQIKLNRSGQCVDYNTSTMKVTMYNCNGGNNQKWFYDPSTREWKTLRDGNCLDWGNGNLIMYQCHGGLNQKFWIPTNWPTTTRSTDKVRLFSQFDKCMDAPNDGSNRVLVWDCQNGNPTNQDFYYDESTRQIKLRRSGQCLDYDYNSNNVIMWPCNDGNNQKWFITTRFELKSERNNKVLDWGGSVLYMHSPNNGYHQKFFVPSSWNMNVKDYVADCWWEGTVCGSGTTCNNCCGWADCPWYQFGVCTCY